MKDEYLLYHTYKGIEERYEEEIWENRFRIDRIIKIREKIDDLESLGLDLSTQRKEMESLNDVWDLSKFLGYLDKYDIVIEIESKLQEIKKAKEENRLNKKLYYYIKESIEILDILDTLERKKQQRNILRKLIILYMML